MCVSVISTVNSDKLDKHLKKCNSRQKPRAVSLIQLRKCGRFGDLCVSCDCCVLVCLQVYYVENINSGSADMDEVVQQVNHYCHASAKKEIKHPREFILFNKVMSVKVLKKIEVTNVCVPGESESTQWLTGGLSAGAPEVCVHR